MLRKPLFLLFIIVPAIELTLIILSGKYVGIPLTFLIIVLTGIIGGWLAKKEGAATLAKIKEELAMGRMPGQHILEGLCVLIGGILLLTPGFLTDLTGFSLLLSPIRRMGVSWLQTWLRRQAENGNFIFFYRR
ncbi:FxsA family protein [Tuberibacillus sp. Marseille-P3662]|uniref:FxsA family protein n=1 Tax=Tuberibacillus sp. Marseille-P3662 TaxID=1965358 RepID=UPI000A1CAF04|nr:FxsA family protein [Tuberibacillus sp. Marseille-P3662]